MTILEQEFLTPIQLKLIELLTKKGAMTRYEICEEFGYKKIPSRKIITVDGSINQTFKNETIEKIGEQYEKQTTIHDNLVKLQNKKLVEKVSYNNGKRGRPIKRYKLTS